MARACVCGELCCACVCDESSRGGGTLDEVVLTDDVNADVHRIKQWYKDRGVKGKHPEKFILGEGLD